MDSLKNIKIGLYSLTVFRNALSDDVVKSFIRLADTRDGDTENEVLNYCDFVSKIYKSENGLSRHVFDLVTDDENVFINRVSSSEMIPDVFSDAVENDIEVLQSLADLTSEKIKSYIKYSGFLPSYRTEKIDIEKEYMKRCADIGKYGYGIYSKNYAFYIEDGKITPVRHPDKIRLSDLADYEDEKKQVIDNTIALLNGKPAANVLLAGDAGTGKSSTVKAVVNEFKDDGLRIIEIRKEQLREIPKIMDELDSNPLKFILFIDDLSFTKADDNFSALKALLEGTVSAKSGNVAIYATSNRRHIVKESFAEREGDDIHRNDTIQELMSLSERFGLTVTYVKPNKQTYLDIVKKLAEQENIKVTDDLLAEAERFEIRKGGRSARVAKQFIDKVISET